MNGCTSITWFGLTKYYTPKARCLDKLSKIVNMDFFCKYQNFYREELIPLVVRHAQVYNQINLKGQCIMRENK